MRNHTSTANNTRNSRRVNRQRVNQFRVQFLQTDASPPCITPKPTTEPFLVASTSDIDRRIHNDTVFESPTKAQRYHYPSLFLPRLILDEDTNEEYRVYNELLASHAREDIRDDSIVHQSNQRVSVLVTTTNEISRNNQEHDNRNHPENDEGTSTIVTTPRDDLDTTSSENLVLLLARQEQHQYPLRQRKAISLFPYTLNTWTRSDDISSRDVLDRSILYEPMEDIEVPEGMQHDPEFDLTMEQPNIDYTAPSPSTLSARSEARHRKRAKKSSTTPLLSSSNSIESDNDHEDTPLLELIARRLAERAQNKQQTGQPPPISTTPNTNDVASSSEMDEIPLNTMISNDATITVLSSSEEDAPQSTGLSRRTKRRILESSDESDGVISASENEDGHATSMPRYKVPRKVTAGALRGKLPASFIRINRLEQWRSNPTLAQNKPPSSRSHNDSYNTASSNDTATSTIRISSTPPPMDSLIISHNDVFAQEEPDSIDFYNDDNNNYSLASSLMQVEELASQQQQHYAIPSDSSSSDIEDNTFHPGYFPSIKSNTPTRRKKQHPSNTRSRSTASARSSRKRNTIRNPSSRSSAYRPRSTSTRQLRRSLTNNPFLRNYHRNIVEDKRERTSKTAMPHFLHIAHRQFCRPISISKALQFDRPRQKLIHIQEPAVKRNAKHKRVNKATTRRTFVEPMESDYIHHSYNGIQDHFDEQQLDLVNVLPRPPDLLTFTGLANGYKEEGSEMSLEQSWHCMGHTVQFSNVEEVLIILPTLLARITRHMSILLGLSDEVTYHEDRIDEATCHQLFCRIFLFIERFFVLSDNLPSAEHYKLLLTSIEQLFVITLEWESNNRLGYHRDNISIIALFIEMRIAMILWLDLLARPARDEMSLHVDCSSVCNDTLNLLLRMIQHQMTYLLSFDVTSTIEALRQLYSRNTFNTSNDIGYWLLCSWCTIVQVAGPNEFWQEFNMMLMHNVTPQQNVRHQPTATWSLDNVDLDDRQRLQAWIIVASHLQHLSIRISRNTMNTHEEYSGWLLLQLLMNTAINQSHTTAINALLTTSWQCVTWFNWSASVPLLRLVYSYFDSMQLMCSANAIELSNFLNLLGASMKSLVNHIELIETETDRSRETRVLSALVSRFLPTRIIRFPMNNNDITSYGESIEQRRDQLHHHCNLVVTLADATIPLVDRPYSDLLFRFLPPDTRDLVARRICLRECLSLARVYCRHGRQPVEVIAKLTQELEQACQHYESTSSTLDCSMLNMRWKTEQEQRTRWINEILRTLSHLIDEVNRSSPGDLHAISCILLNQGWYHLAVVTSYRYPMLIREEAHKLVRNMLDCWLKAIPITSTTSMDLQNKETAIQKMIDQHLLAPLHQLLTRVSIHNLLPLGEDKTIKETLLEQLTELFAQCTWTMVRRHAKSWESFLFDYSKYSLMLISSTKSRNSILLIYLNRLLVLDHTLLILFDDVLLDIWFKSIGAPDTSSSLYRYTNTLSSMAREHPRLSAFYNVTTRWPITNEAFGSLRESLLIAVIKQMGQLHWTTVPDALQIRKDTHYIKSLLISLKDYYQSIEPTRKLTYATTIQRIITAITKHGAVFLADSVSHRIHLNELVFFTQAEFKVSLSDRWSVIQRIRHLPQDQVATLVSILTDRYFPYVKMDACGQLCITDKAVLVASLRNTLLEDNDEAIENRQNRMIWQSNIANLRVRLLEQSYKFTWRERATLLIIYTDIIRTWPSDWLSLGMHHRSKACKHFYLEATYTVQLIIRNLACIMNDISPTTLWLWSNLLTFITTWIETHQALTIQYDLSNPCNHVLITFWCKLIPLTAPLVESNESSNLLRADMSSPLDELQVIEQKLWQLLQCRPFNPPSLVVDQSNWSSMINNNAIDLSQLRQHIHMQVQTLYQLGKQWDRSLSVPASLDKSIALSGLDYLYPTRTFLL